MLYKIACASFALHMMFCHRTCVLIENQLIADYMTRLAYSKRLVRRAYLRPVQMAVRLPLASAR
jgi:hypothetical protein